MLALAFAPAPQERTAPWPRHGSYIGRERCAECHDFEEAAVLGGSHRQAVLDPHMQACETCHGPAQAHADDIDNKPGLITYPPKLDWATQKRLCGRCHADAIATHGGDLEGFATAGKLCTSCHRVHVEKAPQPFPGVQFLSRQAAVEGAAPAGAQKCVACHPRQGDRLLGTGHAGLAVAAGAKGCETCHGNGDKHVATGGLARLITRPDQAEDGIATCRSCHGKVDPVEFHWLGKHKPLLSEGMTCTTCHRVHTGHETGTKAPAVAPAPLVESRHYPISPPPGDGSTPENQVCAKCHQPAFGVLHGSIHDALGRRDIPLDQGCGACHVGAAEHAVRSGSKQYVQSMRGTDAATQIATCAKCHDQDHALRESRHGAHFKNQVTCLSCHSPAATRGRVREDATQRCATCHAQVAAELRMPNHHPVKLGPRDHGTMSCVDCHEPHGARPRIRDRQLRENSCVKCHTQYRGPFVFAHQASRTDGCVICHTPHGSPNRRMLKQVSSQQNCLQCHGDFPSFHDQTAGAVFTNCLKCHTEVHGSNHSRYFFR